MTESARPAFLTRVTERYPTLAAATVYAIAVLLAFNRFFSGMVLLPVQSDQLDGYPPRLLAAQHIKEFGSIPEWSPYLFGGFPFISNTGFGDTFFPTALLRLLFPVDQGMALGFMIFVFLAGVFFFVFLRALGLSWSGAFVGGAAYMFSGMVISLVSPGHDGKLYVSAMAPLALTFLYKAARTADWRYYLYFGVVVGLSLLTPHFQATYYMLMAAGFFWFFMIFLSKEKHESETWLRAGLLFAGALVIGFAVASIQLLPFMEYVPFSPRGDAESSSQGWEYATSWSMPPEEMIGVFLPGFNASAVQFYFGRNFAKLHSDYMGAVAGILALASFGLAGRRRYTWFFVFLASYAALFGFGGHTPFYYLPYNILPYIDKTRAPSVIFFLASLSFAVLAAFGAEYVINKATAVTKAAKRAVKQNVSLLGQFERPVLYGFGALALLTLLATVGGLRPIAEAIANYAPPGYPPEEARQIVLQKMATLDYNYPAFVTHMWMALILATITIALLIPTTAQKLGREALGVIVGIVVLTDLWLVERAYIRFSPRAAQIMAADEVVAALKADTTLHRVVPLPLGDQTYLRNYFMVHRVRTALGYNGFELHLYDELLGGKNSWTENPLASTILMPRLWNLLGARYVVSAAPIPPADSLPERIRPLFKDIWANVTPVGDSLRSHDGGYAWLYRLNNPVPYAFLAPVAWKQSAEFQRLLATLMSPQYDPRSLLFLPADATAGQETVAGPGVPIDNPVSAREERPGHLVFELERPAENDAFLYVAENYYKAWRAEVDGEAVEPVRAQVSLMAVPVKAGARRVELDFSLSSYHTGRLITLSTLAAVLIIAALGYVQKRREVNAPARNTSTAAG